MGICTGLPTTTFGGPVLIGAVRRTLKRYVAPAIFLAGSWMRVRSPACSCARVESVVEFAGWRESLTTASQSMSHLTRTASGPLRELLPRGEADDRLRRQLEAGAARDHAAGHVADRLAHDGQARLGRAVAVVDARLPAGQVRLVEGVEHEERLRVRLAEGERQRVVVVGALRGLRDGLRGLGLLPGVERRLVRRDLALDAELAVDDREARPRLRRPVEAGEHARELAVVGDRDRGRLRMLERGRQARVVLVRVDVEGVHDRRGAAGGLVRRDQVGGEDRRRMRVLACPRPVDPARRQRAADDVDARRDGLERVVGAGEQRFVRDRGGVAAVEVELRQPEAVVVRLVADDQLGQRRVAPRDRGGERGEVVLLGDRVRRRPVSRR